MPSIAGTSYISIVLVLFPAFALVYTCTFIIDKQSRIILFLKLIAAFGAVQELEKIVHQNEYRARTSGGRHP